MIQQLQDFIRSHPAGFTDTELMAGIPEAFWSRATRELYEMAFVDKTIHYDAATDLFIQRRIDAS